MAPRFDRESDSDPPSKSKVIEAILTASLLTCWRIIGEDFMEKAAFKMYLEGYIQARRDFQNTLPLQVLCSGLMYQFMYESKMSNTQKECNCLLCVVSNSENHLSSKWSLIFDDFLRNHRYHILFGQNRTPIPRRVIVKESCPGDIMCWTPQGSATAKRYQRSLQGPKMRLIKGDPGVREKSLLIHHPPNPQNSRTTNLLIFLLPSFGIFTAQYF